MNLYPGSCWEYLYLLWDNRRVLRVVTIVFHNMTTGSLKQSPKPLHPAGQTKIISLLSQTMWRSGLETPLFSCSRALLSWCLTSCLRDKFLQTGRRHLWHFNSLSLLPPLVCVVSRRLTVSLHSQMSKSQRFSDIDHRGYGKVSILRYCW